MTSGLFSLHLVLSSHVSWPQLGCQGDTRAMDTLSTTPSSQLRRPVPASGQSHHSPRHQEPGAQLYS